MEIELKTILFSTSRSSFSISPKIKQNYYISTTSMSRSLSFSWCYYNLQQQNTTVNNNNNNKNNKVLAPAEASFIVLQVVYFLVLFFCFWGD